MFERMSSRVVVGVLATLVALAGVQAWAVTCTTSRTSSSSTCCSWKTTSSGYTYCALWCTGSEICTNTIAALGGNVVKGCADSGTCPVTECSAYGTVSTDLSTGTCDTSLTDLNSTCGIKGLAICTNPADHFNYQGNSFTLSGSESATGNVTTCDKKGKCTNQLKLEPSDTSNICVNPNWHFQTFTASEFKAHACLCPGGYADNGQCCATSSRIGPVGSTTCGDGGTNVYGDGTPVCMTALCTVDLSEYNPFTNFSLGYDCHPSTAVTCGGLTGNPCPTN
jgi:hypothetical protein